MSDSSNSTPQMGQAVNADQALQNAAQQSQPTSTNGELPQEVLEKMSGAELKEYFERQKNKETPQAKPRQPDGKFAPKQEAKTPDQIKEAAAEARRKLKIDDQEVDEEEVIKTYKQRKQHQAAASKELNEGKAARKQAEEFISMMRDQTKLMDAIKKLGHDPRKLAEQYLAEQLQHEMMDPRERELLEAKNKLRSFEEMERRQKEEIAKRYHEEQKAKYAGEYQAKFIDALKETNLPPTKPMVAEMAKYIGRAAKMGYEMTPVEAAKLVLEDVQTAHRRLIGDSDAETLLRLLGEEVVNKIRKHDVSRLKSPDQFLYTPSKSDQPHSPRERGPSSNKRMTTKEWNAFKRKK